MKYIVAVKDTSCQHSDGSIVIRRQCGIDFVPVDTSEFWD